MTSAWAKSDGKRFFDQQKYPKTPGPNDYAPNLNALSHVPRVPECHFSAVKCSRGGAGEDGPDGSSLERSMFYGHSGNNISFMPPRGPGSTLSVASTSSSTEASSSQCPSCVRHSACTGGAPRECSSGRKASTRRRLHPHDSTSTESTAPKHGHGHYCSKHAAAHGPRVGDNLSHRKQQKTGIRPGARQQPRRSISSDNLTSRLDTVKIDRTRHQQDSSSGCVHANGSHVRGRRGRESGYGPQNLLFEDSMVEFGQLSELTDLQEMVKQKDAEIQHLKERLSGGLAIAELHANNNLNVSGSGSQFSGSQDTSGTLPPPRYDSGAVTTPDTASRTRLAEMQHNLASFRSQMLAISNEVRLALRNDLPSQTKLCQQQLMTTAANLVPDELRSLRKEMCTLRQLHAADAEKLSKTKRQHEQVVAELKRSSEAEREAYGREIQTRLLRQAEAEKLRFQAQCDQRLKQAQNQHEEGCKQANKNFDLERQNFEQRLAAAKVEADKTEKRYKLLLDANEKQKRADDDNVAQSHDLELERLTDQLRVAGKEVAEQAEMLSTVKMENSTLVSRVVELENYGKKLEADKTAELDRAQQEMLLATKMEEQKWRSFYEQRLVEAEQRRIELERDAAQARQAFQAEQQKVALQFNAAEQRIRELEADLDAKQNTLENEHTEADQQSQHLQAQVSELEASLKAKQITLDDYIASLSALEQHDQQLAAKNCELQKQYSQLNAKHTQTNTQLEQLRSQIEDLRVELEEKQVTIDAKQNMLEYHMALSQPLEKKVEEKQNAIVQLQMQNKTLMEQNVSCASALQQQIDERTTELFAAKRELQSATDLLESERATCAELNQNIEQVSTQLHALQTARDERVADAERLVGGLRTELANIQQRNVELQYAGQQSRDDCREWAEKFAIYEREMCEKLNEQKVEISQLTKEHFDDVVEYERLNRKWNELNETFAANVTMLAERDQRIAQLDQNLNATANECERLTSQVERQRTVIFDLKEQYLVCDARNVALSKERDEAVICMGEFRSAYNAVRLAVSCDGPHRTDDDTDMFAQLEKADADEVPPSLELRSTFAGFISNGYVKFAVLQTAYAQLEVAKHAADQQVINLAAEIVAGKQKLSDEMQRNQQLREELSLVTKNAEKVKAEFDVEREHFSRQEAALQADVDVAEKRYASLIADAEQKSRAYTDHLTAEQAKNIELSEQLRLAGAKRDEAERAVAEHAQNLFDANKANDLLRSAVLKLETQEQNFKACIQKLETEMSKKVSELSRLSAKLVDYNDLEKRFQEQRLLVERVRENEKAVKQEKSKLATQLQLLQHKLDAAVEDRNKAVQQIEVLLEKQEVEEEHARQRSLNNDDNDDAALKQVNTRGLQIELDALLVRLETLEADYKKSQVELAKLGATYSKGNLAAKRRPEQQFTQRLHRFMELAHIVSKLRTKEIKQHAMLCRMQRENQDLRRLINFMRGKRQLRRNAAFKFLVDESVVVAADAGADDSRVLSADDSNLANE